jgi:hypothetical protein
LELGNVRLQFARKLTTAAFEVLLPEHAVQQELLALLPHGCFTQHGPCVLQRPQSVFASCVSHAHSMALIEKMCDFGVRV